MPPKPLTPRTRADEMVRARGLLVKDVAQRTGIHRSNLSRILTGMLPLSAKNAVRLAEAVGCDVTQITEAPIGSPIPPRQGEQIPVTAGQDYVQRLRAMASMIGTDIDGLMRFQIYGDLSRIPDAYADRLRREMAA